MTTTKPTLPGIFSARLLALNAAVTSSRSGFAAVGSGLSVVSFVRPVAAEAEPVWAGVTFMAASSSIALSPPTPKAPGMTLAFVEESGVPQADPINTFFARLYNQIITWIWLWITGGITSGGSSSYIWKVDLKNYSDGNSVINYIVQGFAVGTTYCYSFEIKSDNTDHNLYRYNMNTGALNKMTKDSSVGPLGHCNDMALERIDDKTYMYVAVSHISPPAIVKLEYIGNTYYERARYTYDPFIIGVTTYTDYYGITSLGHVNGNAIEFVLKRENRLFTVFIGHDQVSGKIYPSYRCTLTIPSKYNRYGQQTVHYEDGKGYVSYWGGREKPNENVVLAYTNINPSILPKRHSGAYEINNSNVTKFEIEGIGFPRGRANSNENDVLWFSIFREAAVNGAIYTYSRAIK